MGYVMINKETDSILQSKQQSYNLMTYCYLSKIPVNWSNGDFNQLYCKSDLESSSYPSYKWWR